MDMRRQRTVEAAVEAATEEGRRERDRGRERERAVAEKEKEQNMCTKKRICKLAKSERAWRAQSCSEGAAQTARGVGREGEARQQGSKADDSRQQAEAASGGSKQSRRQEAATRRQQPGSTLKTRLARAQRARF